MQLVLVLRVRKKKPVRVRDALSNIVKTLSTYETHVADTSLFW